MSSAIGIGFHTDAFNSSHKSFEQALAWAREHDVRLIECGVIEGACWIQGLGHFPHVSLLQDPHELRETMDSHNVQFAQICANYPLAGADGMSVGVPYVKKAIEWAREAGSPMVSTTDGVFRPDGISEFDAFDSMKRCYGEILEAAEANGVVVTVEVHGHFTSRADYLSELLELGDGSPWLKLTLDTGNSLVAGTNPVELAAHFLDHLAHVHLKDVPAELVAAARGVGTGTEFEDVAVGQGANAENIRIILQMLGARGYDGAVTIECEGKGGPLLAESLEWVRNQLPAADLEERETSHFALAA